MSHRGLFVTFEGPEASGKSSTLEIVCSHLAELGVRYLRTREPGGTRLGSSIRSILLKREFMPSPLAEFLLFQADRAQHVGDVIRPAIDAGYVVLCDRYVLSSIAYQVGGRGLPEAEASQVIAFATGGLIPDLTVVLTVDLDLSLKRLGGRRDINRIDAETKEFHRSIHQAYRDLCGSHWAKSWLMIDTTPDAMTPAVVAQGVVDRIVRELDSA